VIHPAERFRAALRQAVHMVDQWPGRTVLFGVKPTYPAEVFGYIHRGAAIPMGPGAEAKWLSGPTYVVKQFREKPNAATAKEYLDSGEYYWNSGIFVWRATTILNELRVRQPEMVRRLELIVSHWDTPERDAVFEQEFAGIHGLSIDYAVMDHAVTDSEVVVIEAPFEWDDLGSWQSLARLTSVDEHGNTVVGKHLGVDTLGTIVRTDDEHLVVTLGINDCIVVHTPNATLVASKHNEEQIRKVVKQLEELGWTAYL
jgi:mannose-1-phosphate guanylyltransferase